MNEPLRIYIAGPYSPVNENKHSCIQEAAQNVDKAISVGLKLMKKGHYVFIPHLSHFVHTHHECDREWPWYDIDNTFLKYWANALFYIGSSKGADNELKYAKKLGYLTYLRLEDVPEVE